MFSLFHKKSRSHLNPNIISYPSDFHHLDNDIPKINLEETKKTGKGFLGRFKKSHTKRKTKVLQELPSKAKSDEPIILKPSLVQLTSHPPTSHIPDLEQIETPFRQSHSSHIENNSLLNDLSSLAVIDEPLSRPGYIYTEKNNISPNYTIKKPQTVRFKDSKRISKPNFPEIISPSKLPSKQLQHLNNLSFNIYTDSTITKDDINESFLLADVSHSTSRESLNTAKRLDKFYEEYQDADALDSYLPHSNSSATLTGDISNDVKEISIFEVDTFKAFPVKNYLTHDSKLKVISPHRVPLVSVDTHRSSLESTSKPVILPDKENSIYEVKASKINPANLISKDEVYRKEMLSLIQSHSVMVHRKQAEINHLRRLLQQERNINSKLSSAKYPSTLNKSSPCTSPKLNPNDEGKKSVRKKFIPMDIRVTNDSKPINYIPYTKYVSELLPPFQLETDENTPSFSNVTLQVDSNACEGQNFIPKPFHVKSSPHLYSTPDYSPETRHEQNNEFPLSINSSKHTSNASSLASSAYFTAFEDSSEHIDHNDNTTILISSKQTDFSASTNESSIISKQTCSSDSIHMNASLITSTTIPDSIEFVLEKGKKCI